MRKANILFFHSTGLFYGGTERLLQIMATRLAKHHNVFYMYAPVGGEQRRDYFTGSGVTLVPFSFTEKEPVEPYTPLGMEPSLLSVIRAHRIEVICTPVSAHYQFPLNSVPASIPFITTSPFGHYASNGNVRKVYVSGTENLARLKKRGIQNAELMYDPLEDFPAWVRDRGSVGTPLVFGRLGRPDDQIFDPISIRAFAKLEQKYGEGVRYLVLSPPPKMKVLAKELGVKNLVIADESRPQYWEHFYRDIDVLAHARLDGETFGKAIAEAMLSGVPVITHRSRFHNEHLNIVKEEFARWSEPDDVDGYFAHMEWFVKNKDRIRPMGELARERALALFNPDVILTPIVAEFERAALACTYFNRRSWATGYGRLYMANARMFPFYLAKRLAHRFLWFRRMATKLYTKRPLY